MCGIVGFLDRSKEESAAMGKTILKMLDALARRGPDSAGIAVYGVGEDESLVLRVMFGKGAAEGVEQQIVEQGKKFGRVQETSSMAEYVRLVIDYDGDIKELEQAIESVDDAIEIVSMGRRLEIVKQVGSPNNLDSTYGISDFVGTHGIGHTRLSTESRIDLSHSQPFWAHGSPDLAIVHNGHITNYHKLRQIYEQQGVRFYTQNDSEVIGVYLACRLFDGMELKQAMEASLGELDGSFSYLVSTREAIGFVRDPFALKPLLFTETDTFVAVATEEVALRSALEGSYEVKEAQAKDVMVWQR